eukprot:6173320-Pleurochrysis_carterae.AAC.2
MSSHPCTYPVPHGRGYVSSSPPPVSSPLLLLPPLTPFCSSLFLFMCRAGGQRASSAHARAEGREGGGRAARATEAAPRHAQGVDQKSEGGLAVAIST